MSNFFPSLVDDIGSLYSNIAQKDLELLNEDSDYYDQEVTEFVEDIISTISISMICERYSADAVLSFFANSTEEVILEKYFSVDKVYITESIVSDEYIQEQFEILDEGIGAALRVLGTGLKMGGKGLLQGAGTALKGAGRTVVTAAKRGMGPGGRKALGAAATKVKEIGTAAKAALTSPMAKNILKGAGIVGLGGLSGFVGAKLAGAGSDDKAKVGPKIVGPKIVGPKSSSPSGGSGSTPSVKAAPTKPAFTAQTGDKAKDMATWAKANPRLAEVERLRASGASRSEINKVMYNKGTAAYNAAISDKPGPGEKKDQTPTQGNPDAKIDTKSVEASKASFKPSAAPAAGNALSQTAAKVMEKPPAFNPTPEVKATTPKPTPVAPKAPTVGRDQMIQRNLRNGMEYDAYDLVLEYLFSQGHVETVEEAHYVMMVMDAETIGTIVEEYENDLLAEEITEWVNELVEGGYDLSEYTWDDLAEYYVNEGFKETGYHDDKDPYSSGFGRRNQSRTTSSRGRRIQNRVRSLEKSGDQEKADRIHKSASSINKAERGLAKSRRNKSRGPGPKRARQDAMRDMKDSDFS
jgi:hypothetical protein